MARKFSVKVCGKFKNFWYANHSTKNSGCNRERERMFSGSEFLKNLACVEKLTFKRQVLNKQTQVFYTIWCSQLESDRKCFSIFARRGNLWKL